MDEYIVKTVSNSDINAELAKIGFDRSYIHKAVQKYEYKTLKIFDIKAPAANILKQLCLSLGFDCAVHRDVVTCKIDKSDCILTASNKQLELLCDKLIKQPFGLKFVAQSIKKVLDKNSLSLKIKDKVLNFERPYLMGIVNITSDSFSDGGQFLEKDKAVEKALQLVEEGADIIDLGAESTRPNFKDIDIKEEQQRLLPVIEAIRSIDKDVLISVDTRNFETARLAVELGADIINDVSCFSKDERMLDVVSELNLPYVLTYSLPLKYEKILEELFIELERKIKYLEGTGIKNIIVDLGIGFGKDIGQNFELLKNIKDFTSLNKPLLVGVSRKSIFSEISSDIFERDILSSQLGLYLISNGINVLRVHNVKMHKQMLNLYSNLIST